MSQDQKPRPLKAVTITGGVDANAPADPEEKPDATNVIAEQKTSAEPSKSGTSLLPAILFLIACALGGVGFSTLPHLMPEMAERLYGLHP